MEKTINNPHAVHLLWTGGWDSTYRLVELSRMDVSILPIYCCDPERDSTTVEKKHMLRILTALSSHAGTKAHFFPVQFIDVNAIAENQEVTRAFQVLSADGTLGSQYEWLARLALKFPGLELGIEKANHEKTSGCRTTILKYGAFKKVDGITVLNQDASTPECCLVMGNFRFPIIEITETEMVENIKAWGYEDIMQLIWFCHTPIGDQPCGMCNPCQQKMEGKMEFLLPEKAQRRYRTFKRAQKRFGDFPARVLRKLVFRNFMK